MEKKNIRQNSDNLVTKVKRKRAKRRHRTQFYYSFLTIVLLVCFVQMSISAILNVSKVVAYHQKISTLESKQIAAQAKNAELKKDIKNFSKTATMESIARNSLKMASKDEVLVIVNRQQTPQPEDKHKKHGFKK